MIVRQVWSIVFKEYVLGWSYLSKFSQSENMSHIIWREKRNWSSLKSHFHNFKFKTTSWSQQVRLANCWKLTQSSPCSLNFGLACSNLDPVAWKSKIETFGSQWLWSCGSPWATRLECSRVRIPPQAGHFLFSPTLLQQKSLLSQVSQEGKFLSVKWKLSKNRSLPCQQRNRLSKYRRG